MRDVHIESQCVAQQGYRLQHKRKLMLDSELRRIYPRPPICLIHIAPRASANCHPNSSVLPTHLFLLALPLDTESRVDEELTDKGEEGHDDGDAVAVVRPPGSNPSHRGLEDSPEDDNCRTLLASLYTAIGAGRTYSKAKSQWGCS
jgi:hypothetical protein